MIELIFIACLTASPSACEERKLVYVETSPMACAMAAQPYLADWVGTHPDWSIAKWRCAAPRRDRET